ncbi:transmembrane protein 70, mitochondrial isoform X1 [Gadus chalcogrammus]|uniref:transmembrane protein 70, mitochondrial isoform X1 n=1 Tax=Gadus chalcogrammus TaxID=1042646 RepID=UPI0024C4C137|nr:transmembrane protein 70, mitochondrial isoform X1 [Gadus chalcogrammus]XP_056451739.1 transmembrane protein 70, mitochondrial isoform X1 [Gadus chalcogrammus]XP_056451740.1 transmembrane protein 70, mitochondrial isoform X1 [Gadus chalcogrammus]
MLYLTLLRGLQRCVGPQSLRNVKCKAQFSVEPGCMSSGLSSPHQRTDTSFLRRSFHSGNVKVFRQTQCKPLLPLCLSSKSLCTSASDYSETGRLVYTGSLGRAIIGVKMFSYTSSGTSLCLMPHVLFKTGLATQSLAVQASFIAIISLFTFVTPVLLHLLTKGYVIRLYHNADQDTYTAVTCNIFLMEKRTVFKQGEVSIPAVAKMFTSFYAGRRSMLVNPDLFQLPSDYNHLMGYDQPFTFSEEDLERHDKG